MIGEGAAVALGRWAFGKVFNWMTAPWTNMMVEVRITPSEQHAPLYRIVFRFINAKPVVVELNEIAIKSPKGVTLRNAVQGIEPQPIDHPTATLLRPQRELNPATDRAGESAYAVFADLSALKGKTAQLTFQFKMTPRDNARTPFDVKAISNPIKVE